MTHTVLRNLIGNALRATPEGGSISLAATPTAQANQLTVTVTDTGRGMAAEQVAQLLNPTATPARGVNGHARSGTGLGWPLCHAFVRRQGGQLELRSQPGSGTTVQFTLPLASPA
jgi:signal transduction histidine kinase